ncbi:hypothetical protein AALT_g11883 [Alternaria alternata]|nr:hypothetical protein AALT_g11883 [Alternaria alternata]
MKILFLLCERSVKLENEITPTSVDGNDNFSDIKRDLRPAFEEQDILVNRGNGDASSSPIPVKRKGRDKTTWKLGGSSMFNQSQADYLRASPNDGDYIDTRQHGVASYLVTFDYFHDE